MSKLNPHAGEFVPSFPTTAIVMPPPAPDRELKPAVVQEPLPALDVDESKIVYSIDFLLQFQGICDRVTCRIPDVVRAPAPAKRIGAKVKGRIVYSVEELLLFQHLYTDLPEDIMWTETLITSALTPMAADKKAKALSKAAKQKEKARLRQEAAAMPYDPSLVCYFNPSEYSAALYAATTGVDPASAGEDGANATPAVDPVEETKNATRQLTQLLDNFAPDQQSAFVTSFQDISITCTQTLQEVIGLLFDRAVAAPALCDAYAQLYSSLSEKTPEFKDGAKTINFRRILLTKCYEALVEEPETVPADATSSNQQTATSPSAVSDVLVNEVSTPATPTSTATAATATTPSTLPQQPWRRQCMLRNVCFVGELFRRQLLTENIMHVCIALMLDDEVQLHTEVIEAACRLINLVGDLLDGSSPASRRTMDEYFDVLQRLSERPELPAALKDLIAELMATRTSGWVKKRLEAASASPSAVKK
ncbi:TPA: hypothetical protein N0F65_000576 [Lagenidium giganteum]|uniref:MIF4G domain-containing protein n=1 Tax=Lagenidium giganteum TaxID=4803 RepID=A0AAV2YGE8_9STRA|nr:TPA: hypothetical protein N0F65_000576 [Lagenidium giganteum]